MRCPDCDKDVEPALTKNGPHIQANCPVCFRYLKFVKKNEIRVQIARLAAQDHVKNKNTISYLQDLL